MNREEHKKFLQQQVANIKAQIFDSQMAVKEQEKRQEELMKALHAVGGAQEALAHEDKQDEEAHKAASEQQHASDGGDESEEVAKQRRAFVQTLKEQAAANHKLPPHIVAQQLVTEQMKQAEKGHSAAVKRAVKRKTALKGMTNN